MSATHPGCSTSYLPSKILTPLLALLLISIRDALLTTHLLLPSHPSGTLITNASSSHTHHSELYNFFITEMEFWLQIALIQLAPLPKGASTRPRVPYCSPHHNELATLLVPLLITVHGPLLTTSSPLPSSLLLVISSNPPSLSPSWPAINFYLISRITSEHLTSNSMLCDNTLLCHRTLFSSPMGSWLCSLQPGKQPSCHSSNLLRYLRSLDWAQLFSLVSTASSTPLLQELTPPLPLLLLLDVPCPDVEAVPVSSIVSTKRTADFHSQVSCTSKIVLVKQTLDFHSQVNSRRASKCTSQFHSQVNCTSKIVLAKWTLDFHSRVNSRRANKCTSHLHSQVNSGRASKCISHFHSQGNCTSKIVLANVTFDFHSLVITNVLSKCTPKNMLPKCTVTFVAQASSLLTSSHSGQARHCGTSLFVVQYSRSCELDTATLPWVLCVECPLWAGFAN